MPRDVHLLDLDAALGKLAAIDARLADLVVLRFFGGLTVEEAAEVLGSVSGHGQARLDTRQGMAVP